MSPLRFALPLALLALAAAVEIGSGWSGGLAVGALTCLVVGAAAAAWMRRDAERWPSRRRALLLWASLAAGGLAALAVGFPAYVIALENSGRQAASTRRLDAVAATGWGDDKIGERVRALESLRDALDATRSRPEREPTRLQSWMANQSALDAKDREVFERELRAGLIDPCKAALEARVDRVDGEHPGEDMLVLARYLMFTPGAVVDPAWAAARCVEAWAAARGKTGRGDNDRRSRLASLGVAYFQRVASGDFPTLGVDPARVERARAALDALPPAAREYDTLLAWIADERLDELRPALGDNARHRAVGLDTIFTGREDGKRFRSLSGGDDGSSYRVAAPFTETGYRSFQALVALWGAAKQPPWSAPGMPAPRPEETAALLRAMEASYAEDHARAWKALLADVDVARPRNVSDALELYGLLAAGEGPVTRLLAAVETHTRGHAAFDGIAKFGRDEDGLARYRAIVGELRLALVTARQKDRGVELGAFVDEIERAREKVAALLKARGSFAEIALAPLLLAPLAP